MSWLANLTNRFKKKEEKVEVVAEVKPTVEKLEIKPKSIIEVPTGNIVKNVVHNTLTEEQKYALIDLTAQGFTPTIVMRKMKELYDVTVSKPSIAQYAHTDKWKPVLKQLRAKYRENIHDIDLSHKANRLRIVEHVADRAIEKDDLRMALKATEEARREFEKNGDGDVNNIFINNPTYNELNVLSTEELLRRKDNATKKLLNKE